MLESELGRLDAFDRVAGSTRGRAGMFRDCGDIDRAVSHAIQSGDRDLAGQTDLAERRVVCQQRPARDCPRLARELHG